MSNSYWLMGYYLFGKWHSDFFLRLFVLQLPKKQLVVVVVAAVVVRDFLMLSGYFGYVNILYQFPFVFLHGCHMSIVR